MFSVHHLVVLRKTPLGFSGNPVRLGYGVATSEQGIPFVTSKFGKHASDWGSGLVLQTRICAFTIAHKRARRKKVAVSAVEMASDLHGRRVLDGLERPNRKCNALLT
jgi:hypothetical protein